MPPLLHGLVGSQRLGPVKTLFNFMVMFICNNVLIEPNIPKIKK